MYRPFAGRNDREDRCCPRDVCRLRLRIGRVHVGPAYTGPSMIKTFDIGGGSMGRPERAGCRRQTGKESIGVDLSLNDTCLSGSRDTSVNDSPNLKWYAIHNVKIDGGSCRHGNWLSISYLCN